MKNMIFFRLESRILLMFLPTLEFSGRPEKASRVRKNTGNYSERYRAIRRAENVLMRHFYYRCTPVAPVAQRYLVTL